MPSFFLEPDPAMFYRVAFGNHTGLLGAMDLQEEVRGLRIDALGAEARESEEEFLALLETRRARGLARCALPFDRKAVLANLKVR